MGAWWSRALSSSPLSAVGLLGLLQVSHALRPHVLLTDDLLRIQGPELLLDFGASQVRQRPLLPSQALQLRLPLLFHHRYGPSLLVGEPGRHELGGELDLLPLLFLAAELGHLSGERAW